MIAHRLSTIKKADKIALLKHGKICAIGSDEELLQTSKEYLKLKTWIGTHQPPLHHQRRRHHAVVGLSRIVYGSTKKPFELAARGFEEHEVLHTRDDPGVLLVVGDGHGAHLCRRLHERMRMFLAVDDRPLPRELLHLDQRLVDRFDVVDVVRQRQRVLLGRTDADLFGVGVRGLFLRVGRQHLALITGQIGVGEITTQTR